MYMSVVVGGRTYGGHGVRDYTIEVRYRGDAPSSDSITTEAFPSLQEDLSQIILGKFCPVDIGDEEDIYVHAGETVARLHVRVLAARFPRIDFSEAPWAKQIEALRERYLRALRADDLEENLAAVEVRVTFDRLSPQKSGRFVLSAPAAHWLGKQLIACSQGGVSNKGVVARVRHGTEVQTDR